MQYRVTLPCKNTTFFFSDSVYKAILKSLSQEPVGLRSFFKTPQLARYGVINRLEMFIDPRVNCAFSSIDALSRTHLWGLITASKLGCLISVG